MPAVTPKTSSSNLKTSDVPAHSKEELKELWEAEIKSSNERVRTGKEPLGSYSFLDKSDPTFPSQIPSVEQPKHTPEEVKQLWKEKLENKGKEPISFSFLGDRSNSLFAASETTTNPVRFPYKSPKVATSPYFPKNKSTALEQQAEVQATTVPQAQAAAVEEKHEETSSWFPKLW